MSMVKREAGPNIIEKRSEASISLPLKEGEFKGHSFNNYFI